MPATSSNLPPTQTMLLHPIGAVLADGSQLFEVVQPAVQSWSASTSYSVGDPGHRKRRKGLRRQGADQEREPGR